jgi:opacity protein-like surface antigen
MHRFPALSLLASLVAAVALVAAPVAARADDVDDYYEDEYDDVDAKDANEATEAEQEAKPTTSRSRVPARLKYARSGFYLYAGLAQGFSHPNASYMAKDPLGVNFKIGARFRRYFGAEFEYQTFPGWNLNFSGGSEKIDVSSFAINGKAYFPIQRFQPFAQFGMGIAMSDAPGSESDIAFEVRVGAGIEVFVTDHITASLTALYTQAFNDLNMLVGSGQAVPASIDNLSYTTLVWSVGYHF